MSIIQQFAISFLVVVWCMIGYLSWYELLTFHVEKKSFDALDRLMMVVAMFLGPLAWLAGRGVK